MNSEMLKSAAMVINKAKWRIKNKVIFEKNTRVYSSCKFEGYNRICSGAYVSKTYLGRGTYLGMNASIISTRIGRYTSVGPCVRVTSGKHPLSSFVSTYPAFFSTRRQAGFTFVDNDLFDEGLAKGSSYGTQIGNDVWIGDSAIIIEGITIGDGAIIGAGAVVTKDIPPYAVAVGVPAKVIKYRFDNETIQKLSDIEWWNRSMDELRTDSAKFSNIDEFIKSFGGKE